MNWIYRELPLRKGDTVYLLQQIDKNWFKGERHGTVGIFPVNYVEVTEYMELLLQVLIISLEFIIMNNVNEYIKWIKQSE